MKSLEKLITELKNSNLIPVDASEFKSKILIKKLLSYTTSRGESFYRTLAIASNKSILQIKYLEESDFSSFYSLLKKASN